MSILRAALLASSSSIPPSCRPAAAPHLCRTAASHHPVCWFTPNNAAAPSRAQQQQQQQFRICLSSSSSPLRLSWRHRREASSPSAFWTRVVSPVVSLIGGSDTLGQGASCSCRAAGGGDVLKWTGGENLPSSSSLLNFADQHQQRPYATGAGNHQTAAAAAAAASSCFSGVGGRRMRSRGDGGAESGSSGRTSSSPNRVRRAFAEDGCQGSGVGTSLTDWEKDKFKEVEIKQTKKVFTLPTVLTLARVAAVPAILAVFYSNEPWATSAGAVIFVLAAVTDWLDGYLARKMGTSSAFGAFLDPVADKLMVAAALVLLCTKPLAYAELAAIPWLLPLPTIAIIGREITMSAVREWAAAQGGDLHKAVAVNSLGKIKTASQMVSITLLLVSGEGGLDSRIAGLAGVGLLYVAAILALWSLAMYMRGISSSMFK